METNACTEDRVKTKERQRPREQTLFHLFRGVFTSGCIHCYLELKLANHSARQLIPQDCATTYSTPGLVY